MSLFKTKSKDIGINPLLTHEPAIFFTLLNAKNPSVRLIQSEFPDVSANDAEKFFRWWSRELTTEELAEARAEFQKKMDECR